MKFKKVISTFIVIFSLVSNNAIASIIGIWSQDGVNLILDLDGQINSSGLSLPSSNYTSDYISHLHNGYSQIIASPNLLSSTWGYFNMAGDWSLVDSTDTSFNFAIFDNQSYFGATSVAFMMGFNISNNSGYLGIDSRFLNGVSNYDQQIQFNGFFATMPSMSVSNFNDFTLSRNGDTFSVFERESSDVPEPSTLAIFALGIIGIASRRFKK